jgi:hypothetical protein
VRRLELTVNAPRRIRGHRDLDRERDQEVATVEKQAGDRIVPEHHEHRKQQRKSEQCGEERQREDELAP